ncbi:MAG: 30S ribosomal protein S20 [Oscillospiraceae bacterium]|jgi:ribosomal protein S20|nr:MAG: 30S ribosomal protein S20 [Oscillospiraceae bacterium]
MANIKSAKKRILVNDKKNLRNRSIKSALKTTVKKFNAAVAEGNKELAASMLPGVISAVDKAAAKGIMHKNAANRKKAELSKAAM